MSVKIEARELTHLGKEEEPSLIHTEEKKEEQCETRGEKKKLEMGVLTAKRVKGQIRKGKTEKRGVGWKTRTGAENVR